MSADFFHFVENSDCFYAVLHLGVAGTQAYLRPDEPDVYEFGEKPRDRMLPLRLLTGQYSGSTDVVTKMLLGNPSDSKLRQCTK